MKEQAINRIIFYSIQNLIELYIISKTFKYCINSDVKFIVLFAIMKFFIKIKNSNLSEF